MHTILLKIIMDMNTPQPIITIPIILIRKATITIRTPKDTGASKDTRVMDPGDLAGILKATVVTVTGKGNNSP
jgi:hypothetical protein